MKSTRFFFSNSPVKLTRSQIDRILKTPSRLHSPTADPLEPQNQLIEKPKPRTIFELNKSKLDDMLDMWNSTKDIEAVNKKFGVQLKGFKYGLPIPNINPMIKGFDLLQEEWRPTPKTQI